MSFKSLFDLVALKKSTFLISSPAVSRALSPKLGLIIYMLSDGCSSIVRMLPAVAAVSYACSYCYCIKFCLDFVPAAFLCRVYLAGIEYCGLVEDILA